MKVFCTWVLLLALLNCFQEKRDINAFLKTPFDLQKFKNKKGGSNSSVMRAPKYFYKPQEKGVYYSFFLFYPPGFVYKGDETKKINVRPSDGLQVVTFKPDGKNRDMFIDPAETLIEVTSNYNDRDLPELAFVGLDSAIIKKKLGPPHVRKDTCFIYLHNEFALSLRISNGTVEWLHYLRANAPLTPQTFPAELTTLKKRALEFDK